MVTDWFVRFDVETSIISKRLEARRPTWRNNLFPRSSDPLEERFNESVLGSTRGWKTARFAEEEDANFTFDFPISGSLAFDRDSRGAVSPKGKPRL